MAGQLTAGQLQINDNATASYNFVITPDNAGGFKISRGNVGATTQDILTVDSAGNLTGAAIAAATATTAGNGILTGNFIFHAGTTAPTGFLACPVAQTNLSRTTYSALFSAIGTTWGAGDGSTTFGMPWFYSGFAILQSNGNVGVQTGGAVISHTHQYNAGAVAGAGTYGYYESPGYNYSPANAISAAGAAYNYPAGGNVLICVKH